MAVARLFPCPSQEYKGSGSPGRNCRAELVIGISDLGSFLVFFFFQIQDFSTFLTYSCLVKQIYTLIDHQYQLTWGGALQLALASQLRRTIPLVLAWHLPLTRLPKTHSCWFSLVLLLASDFISQGVLGSSFLGSTSRFCFSNASGVFRSQMLSLCVNGH